MTQAVSAVKPGGSTVASGALVSQLAFDCDCVYTVPCIGSGSARTRVARGCARDFRGRGEG